MVSTVADAMRRAADRAARCVELENAKIGLENILGYEIDVQQWPWMSVAMADRSAVEASMKTSAPSQSSTSEADSKRPVSSQALSPGAASDATTVQYPDAEALANAKKGYEAQKKHDAMVAAQRGPATPCASTRPPLVRINSVPVLTPPDKIRRSSTPTPAAEPGVGTTTHHAEPMEPAGDAVVDPGNGDSTPAETQIKKKASKNKRLRRLRKQTSPQEQDQQDQQDMQTTDEIQANAAEQQGSSTAAPAQPDIIPNPDGQVPETPAATPPVEQKRKKKMTARKSGAKAPVTVKAEPLERQNTEQEMQAAQAANLQRANTAAQQTPSPTPPRSDAADAPQQQTAPVVEATQPTSDDIETALEKEMKKEEPGDTPATPPAPQSNREQSSEERRPAKRVRREKTPAEKAAHARYMRFSRSFERKDCPKEMKKAYDNAAYCTAKLQLLQDAWVECDGAWKTSSLYKRMIERTTHKSHGARVWLTRSQIAQKYNSEEMANNICDAKLNDPEAYHSHTKPHPDCPKVESMRQFLVWDSEGFSETTDTVVEDLFSAIDEDTDCEEHKCKKDSGNRKKDKKRRKPSSDSASGKGDESSDDGSDESDGKDKKQKKKRGSKSKARRGKGKKETKEKKEKRMRKEQEKLDKEKDKENQKVIKEKFNKGKKAMSNLNDKIVDACRREKSIASLSPDLKAALGSHITKKKNAMCDLRGKIQSCVDRFDEQDLEKLASEAAQLIEDYQSFLTRSNMK